MEATVILAEILGGQSHVELDVAGNTLIAEIEGRLRAKPGDILKIGIEQERTILFDPKTTLAL